MRRIALAVLLALAASLPGAAGWALAQSPDDAGSMTAANAMYEQGLYADSARAYQQLADRGYRDPALYYNLGNAYYKQGDLGRAILNYVRARRLDPSDPDTATNLELARDHVPGAPAPADDAFAGVAVRASALLARNQAAAAALAAWVIVVGLAGALLLLKPRPRVRRWLSYGAMAAGVLLVAAVLQMSSHTLAGGGNEVVVVAESVDVMSGPGAQYVAEAALPGGTEAELLERRGGWTRITLPDGGLQGWVPAGAVETVDPDSPL